MNKDKEVATLTITAVNCRIEQESTIATVRRSEETKIFIEPEQQHTRIHQFDSDAQ
jgi:hypothetical protein